MAKKNFKKKKETYKSYGVVQTTKIFTDTNVLQIMSAILMHDKYFFDTTASARIWHSAPIDVVIGTYHAGTQEGRATAHANGLVGSLGFNADEIIRTCLNIVSKETNTSVCHVDYPENSVVGALKCPLNVLYKVVYAKYFNIPLF